MFECLRLISCNISFNRYLTYFLHKFLIVYCLECIPEPPNTSVLKNKNSIVDCKLLRIFIELSQHFLNNVFMLSHCSNFSDPAPMFLVTVTMFRPCSDLAPTSPTFLVTLSQPSRCSDLAPKFLVTPSQYYNSKHSLLKLCYVPCTP